MLTPLRALALASLLLAPTLLGANAATTAPDSVGLEFLGFRAGARLDELQRHLRGLGGSRLRCRQSKVDRRVSECRAVLNDQHFGGSVDLWVSAMDSLAGVITLSGVVVPGQLERWRGTLEGSYGRVGTRMQGAQWMLQWVRRGRMIRLTWRLERGAKVASVSLVDGHVLDGWGRSGSAATGPGPAQPTSRTR
ncbi:MAG: hypothetical protein QOH59_318 [Gemmatimonadales bacterium]|jgi:hypothetical protein|nr:hypothetical protein [Gemmatimonadales bacterium]